MVILFDLVKVLVFGKNNVLCVGSQIMLMD